MALVQPLISADRSYRYYRGKYGRTACPICGAMASAALRVWLRRGWANRFLLAVARKRYHKKEGGESCMGRAEEQATKLLKLPDRVAAIVGKTYAVMGDAVELADDQALMMIRDLLDEIDESLIDRNKGKRLVRR